MPQRKKVVFVIVEGNTDRTALECVFRRLYTNRNIRFEVTNGDITSNHTVNCTNVCDILYKKVKNYMTDNKLRKTDFWQIIQIFDTDGAYIPDEAIVEGDTKEFLYSTTSISCKNTKNVIDRNKQKREIMNYLLRTKNLQDIPYQCYFLSSNLDHALYNQQNLNEEEKRVYADAFYQTVYGNEERFIDFLKEEVANGVPDNFPASWKYIKEELHSLERHTNLHLYFKENPYLL